jgi:hypothetical protein
MDGLEVVDVDGRIILNWIFKRDWERVLWIDLVRNTDKRWAVVSTVICSSGFVSCGEFRK